MKAAEQYFPVILFINMYYVHEGCNNYLSLWMKYLRVIIQMKAIE